MSLAFGWLLIFGFHLPTMLLFPVVVIWFLLLARVNRWTIETMDDDLGPPKMPLRRTLCTLLFGAVVALAGTLWALDADLDAERGAGPAGEASAARVQRLRDEERRLLDVIGRPLPTVDQVPTVVSLHERLNALEEDLSSASDAVVCEEDGTCGSGQEGRGPKYDTKVERREQLRRDRDTARDDLQRATDEAEKLIDALAAEQWAARMSLPTTQAELDELEKLEIAADRAPNTGGSELLERIVALPAVAKDRPITAAVAPGVVILAFGAADLLALSMLVSRTRRNNYQPLPGGKSPEDQAAEDQRRVDELGQEQDNVHQQEQHEQPMAWTDWASRPDEAPPDERNEPT